MCGIAGIINFNNNLVSDNDIKIMMNKIKHRGPDDEGLFIDNNVGLGFVRLSILDLSSAGHQPMTSNDGKLVIVFNGEIYNYIEIKNELKDDYSFKTGTDTEVILASYQKWGENCLNKFNGMFAFIIYNTETKEVFGARDRFGIKPLYYYIDNERFIFASEIKALLPIIPKVHNDKIIYDYLLFNRTDHTNKTFFKNISKMQHGHYFHIKNKKFQYYKWYDLSEKIIDNKYISYDEYRQLFKDSVKLRLRADVPVGVSLSGGIDSSSITSCLLNDFNLCDLNTFSGVYGKNESADESEFINSYKPLIKNMHYVVPDASMFFNDFNNFIIAHNEPCPDTGPYIQYKVMELASKYVKVTLDGQGADEQLAGYHNFFSIYFIELLKEIKILKFISENFHYMAKHKSFDVLKYFIYYLAPINIQKKINTKLYSSINSNFINNFKHDSTLNEMLYKPKNLNTSLFQHFEYKLEHLLRWEDLNSMYFSIEARVPFLDHRLVELTLSTPPYQKIFRGETKHLLRQSMKDILPKKIMNRKDKKGFSNPREKWFRTKQFKEYIFDLINSKSFSERGYFDASIANKQYSNHLAGKIDASNEIWKWINLEVWFNKFVN